MVFTQTNKTPGVYIDEIQLPGPIAGVGTSTVAIVGPASRGRRTPFRVTNPTQFTAEYGDHITAPPFYASHAVHGFFRNGGTTCYFVRVTTAVRSSRPLLDRAGQPTLLVTAKEEGAAGDGITVEVQDANIVAAVAVVKAAAALAADTAANDRQADVDDASDFAPGDVVVISGGGNNELATISSIDGSTLHFSANLTNPYLQADPTTIRIADLGPGDSRIRVADSAGIEAGSYISISQQGGTNVTRVVSSVEPTNSVLTLAQPLAAGETFDMTAAAFAVNVQTLEFTLIITHPTAGAEAPFANLAMDPRHSRYYPLVVDSNHVDVAAVDPPNVTPPTNNRPAVLAASPLAGGADDDPSALTDQDFRNAIDELERVDAVNMLCVPDRTNQAIQQYMIDHCAGLQDRFAILDPQRNAGPQNGIVGQRNLLATDRGFGALYYPQIVISAPGGGRMTVPPSGHIAGVFARTDQLKGVHKAPANEVIQGCLELERTLNDTEAGLLNEQSVNILRFFRGRGFRVWGARTLASSTQWRYVNVRRLMLFIEESIQEATEAFVFDPNNLALWETIKRQVSGFLNQVWQDGALFGATPEEAFRVRIDEELNPAETRALGELHIEVIVFPTTPAEFIVFHIIQEPGGPRLVEL